MIITDDKLVIEGYVARDQDNILYFYDSKPKRDVNFGCWISHNGESHLKNISFPNLKWEDEPIKVELTIKRIQ